MKVKGLVFLKHLNRSNERDFSTRITSHHTTKRILDKFFPKEKIDKTEFLNILEKTPNRNLKTIYVHTPYCDKICSFCNLNREQVKENLQGYAEYIASEFDSYGKTRYVKESEFEVIYFGGGTPTIYKADQLELILSSVTRNIKFSKNHEFTFETTLHNLTDEKLRIMEKHGVNRLSIGIQSFSDKGRKFYNRTYTKDVVIKKLKKLKNEFSGSVCTDIIYNFPNQTLEEAREDAQIIKELGIESSSFYSLMVREGSELSKNIKAGSVNVYENLEKEKLLHDTFFKELVDVGNYFPLELTKLAKIDGDEYKYIKVRNNGGDTLPIGVSSGGNIGNLGIFKKSKEEVLYTKKSDLREMLDKLYGVMQFPTFYKANIEEIIGENLSKEFKKKIFSYIDKGYITEDEKSYSLTGNGIFWGNNISHEILEYLTRFLYEHRKTKRIF